MILYRKKPIDLKAVNLVQLDASYKEDDEVVEGYLYLSLDVYSQAVRLDERFDGNIDTIIGVLQCAGMNEKEVSYFVERAPKPIKALGAYLAWADDVTIPCDMSSMYGILHQLSTFINFNKFLLVDTSLRNDVKITRDMLEGVQDAWDTIELNLRRPVDIPDIKPFNLDMMSMYGLGCVITADKTLIKRTDFDMPLFQAPLQPVPVQTETHTSIEEFSDNVEESIDEPKEDDGFYHPVGEIIIDPSEFLGGSFEETIENIKNEKESSKKEEEEPSSAIFTEDEDEDAIRKRMIERFSHRGGE